MGGNKGNPKELMKLLIALVCILGMCFLVVVIAGKYILLPLFGSPNRGLNFVEIVIAFAVISTSALIGVMIGIACFAIIMRPLMSREEMGLSLTQPSIPLLTAFGKKLFHVLYKK